MSAASSFDDSHHHLIPSRRLHGGSGMSLITRRRLFATLIAILIIASVLNGLIIHRVIGVNSRGAAGGDCSHISPPPRAIEKGESTDANTADNHERQTSKQPHNVLATTLSNLTFIGISHTVETVSDAAINFLAEAACLHGIKSYILLGNNDDNSSEDGLKALKLKILALILNKYLPLHKSEDSQNDLECKYWIRVRMAPNHTELLNMTQRYIGNTNSTALKELQSQRPISHIQKQLARLKNITIAEKELEYPENNPLDPVRRIARIKRSREYQRQQLLQNVIQWGSQYRDSRYDTVVGVMDLDLFAYPDNLEEIIRIAERYVIPSTSSSEKYHAICANGLQISDGRRSYYDIFSTILLPNTWLYRSSGRAYSRKKAEGEDETLVKMNQYQTLKWFLKEGRKDPTRVTSTKQQYNYNVVPVRSCFNGLTLYRADIFFHPDCRYDSIPHKDDERYMSRGEMHTCEHVMFHECLRRTLKQGVGDGFRIGVKPDMATLWHLIN